MGGEWKGKVSKSEHWHKKAQQTRSNRAFYTKSTRSHYPHVKNQGRVGPFFPAPARTCGDTLQGNAQNRRYQISSSHDGDLDALFYFCTLDRLVDLGTHSTSCTTLTRVPLIIGTFFSTRTHTQRRRPDAKKQNNKKITPKFK